MAALGRRLPLLLALALAVGSVALLGALDLARQPAQVAGAGRDDVSILAGEPATLDPAREGDSASAAVSAQLFETLTTYDPDLVLRPALAASWEVLDGGRRILFHLRPGLTFSDGTPLTAADVVRSWLRILDPASPSPLASLALDVEGASAYLRGESRDPSTVGFRVSGNDIEVRLARPTDFVAVVASPTFGVVPPSIDREAAPSAGGTFVGSGAYRIDQVTATALVLAANDRYWAGPPPIRTVRLAFDIGGRSPVEVFARGELDYAPISPFDASWIAWDRELGPQLRSVPALATDFFGFDTSRPPFDDVRVRCAFARAVDWRRIVALAAGDRATPATSLVPLGIPGRSGRDFGPVYDPAAARALLAEAGYPGGSGFPPVTLVSAGYDYDEAVASTLHTALGIDVHVERMPADQYFARLSADPPAFWSLGWVADYPSPNDFLGILLGTDRSSNYTRWSSSEFDAAIAEATAAGDPGAARAAYERAEAIVQRDVPAIPVSYSTGWALTRDGLLGATQNGLGILRLAGLAWSDR